MDLTAIPIVDFIKEINGGPASKQPGIPANPIIPDPVTPPVTELEEEYEDYQMIYDGGFLFDD